jgi:uncharacterized protein
VVGIQHAPPRLSRLSGPVRRQIRRKRRDLMAVAAAHDLTNLRVSGNVARGEDRPDTDVDLFVDLPPDQGLLGLGRSRKNWRSSSARVDLVSASELRPTGRGCAEYNLAPL